MVRREPASARDVYAEQQAIAREILRPLLAPGARCADCIGAVKALFAARREGWRLHPNIVEAGVRWCMARWRKFYEKENGR